MAKLLSEYYDTKQPTSYRITSFYQEVVQAYHLRSIKITDQEESRTVHDDQYDTTRYSISTPTSYPQFIKAKTVRLVNLTIPEDKTQQLFDDLMEARSFKRFLRQRPDLQCEMEKWKTWNALNK